ncbi:MAG: phospholipase D-like domain-containing protein [Nitrososphaerota archaeon]|nr:phospholipase D-like domain-containing protein [Nitrososphaerota archaeon]
MGSIIDEHIFSAKDYVWICSPWISNSYAKRLSQLSNKGVSIKIITMDDERNREAISILDRSSIELLTIKLKYGTLHAKIYIMDGKYAICGSANLTESGINNNIESIILFDEIQIIRELERDFMRLWNDLKVEKKPSLLKSIITFLKKMIKI